jgi:hypothetical protein
VRATLKRRAEEAERAAKKARGAEPVLFRRYRVGELPDIQTLRLSGLLGPLAQLTAADAGLAAAALGAVAGGVAAGAAGGEGGGSVADVVGAQRRVLLCGPVDFGGACF